MLNEQGMPLIRLKIAIIDLVSPMDPIYIDHAKGQSTSAFYNLLGAAFINVRSMFPSTDFALLATDCMIWFLNPKENFDLMRKKMLSGTSAIVFRVNPESKYHLKRVRTILSVPEIRSSTKLIFLLEDVNKKDIIVKYLSYTISTRKTLHAFFYRSNIKVENLCNIIAETFLPKWLAILRNESQRVKIVEALRNCLIEKPSDYTYITLYSLGKLVDLKKIPAKYVEDLIKVFLTNQFKRGSIPDSKMQQILVRILKNGSNSIKEILLRNLIKLKITDNWIIDPIIQIIKDTDVPSSIKIRALGLLSFINSLDVEDKLRSLLEDCNDERTRNLILWGISLLGSTVDQDLILSQIKNMSKSNSQILEDFIFLVDKDTFKIFLEELSESWSFKYAKSIAKLVFKFGYDNFRKMLEEANVDRNIKIAIQMEIDSIRNHAHI